MRRVFRIAHNTLLRVVTLLAAAAFWLGALSLDSESWIPVAMVAGSLLWIVIFFIANDK